MILGWASLKVVRRLDTNEALLVICGIATLFYRAIMSLLNIYLLQNLKAIYLCETSVLSVSSGERYVGPSWSFRLHFHQDFHCINK